MNDVPRLHPGGAAAQMFAARSRVPLQHGTKKENLTRRIFREGPQDAATTRTRSSTRSSRWKRSSRRDESSDLLTRYQCCPPHVRRGGAILCSTTSRRSTASRPRLHRGADDDTDYGSSFERNDVVGYDMAVAAGKKVYEQAGLGPQDVQVVRASTTAFPPPLKRAPRT